MVSAWISSLAMRTHLIQVTCVRVSPVVPTTISHVLQGSVSRVAVAIETAATRGTSRANARACLVSRTPSASLSLASGVSARARLSVLQARALTTPSVKASDARAMLSASPDTSAPEAYALIKATAHTIT
jgi:hypothetical protein